MTRHRSAAVAAVALSVLAATFFLGAAAVRRLNFDEALALRSGWLLLAGIPAEPPFVMPFTVLLGALGHAVADPGAVFLACRLLVAASVLGALAVMAWRGADSAAAAAGTFVLTLLQAAFFVHGLEFRYEAAILVALLLSLGWLVRGRKSDFFLLGLAVSWLVAHHWKGVFFGLVVCGLVYLRGQAPSGALRRFHAALLAGVAAWLGIAGGLGLLPEAFAFYRTFARLAASAPGRVWPWVALGPALGRDALWWLVGGAALAWTAVSIVLRRRDESLGSADFPALVLSLACLAFPFLHPHPWPYMLAPAAPFVALLAVRRFREMRRNARAVSLLVVLAGALLQNAGPSPIGTAYRASFEAPRGPEVATLRLLRRLARPGEKVIDPSGLGYFLPPCRPDWYIDSLFQEAAQQGRWMADLQGVTPSDCTLVVDTYRLDMLPEGTRRLIASAYVFVPGGLGLPKGDPRLSRADLRGGLTHGRIDSFW